MPSRCNGLEAAGGDERAWTSWLLELGHGFCFEARQKRILIGDSHNCHVLLELPAPRYRKNMMTLGDNPPVRTRRRKKRCSASSRNNWRQGHTERWALAGHDLAIQRRNLCRAATSQPQVPFPHKLVLNQWLLSLFNVKHFEELAEHLRHESLEGLDENNVHHFHHALTAQLFNLTQLPPSCCSNTTRTSSGTRSG
jgi:hypothetical protein